MADSTYKLIYFDIRGMAECIRYMFAYFDVEFEDSRIAREDWPAIKEQQPFGKIPVLEVDEKQLSQSVAICRYLGKRFGLTTDDPFKDALLEAVVDNMRDVQIKLSGEFLKKTPEAREEAETAFTYTYSKLEPLAADGFFYGSEPTWVDVYFAGMLDTITWYKPDILKPYPNLMALCEKIREKESLKTYLENRPEKE
ncbi:glutathione S-transferase-like [Arctopsyche grandis]|uniref:glutathione S-transferase-like n=1 Tax=Arctopsyche grandis TaxID=121162 RepID=UPI00406D95D7